MTGGRNAAREVDTGLRLRVEIDAATLLRLLQRQLLCAAELRCLDCESKHCLWRLCLTACLECDGCERAGGGGSCTPRSNKRIANNSRL